MGLSGSSVLSEFCRWVKYRSESKGSKKPEKKLILILTNLNKSRIYIRNSIGDIGLPYGMLVSIDLNTSMLLLKASLNT